jgi:hypothetical protein
MKTHFRATIGIGDKRYEVEGGWTMPDHEMTTEELLARANAWAADSVPECDELYSFQLCG